MNPLRAVLRQRMKHAGLTEQDLNAPASAGALAQLAAALPVAVPPVLLELLAMADGQTRSSRPLGGEWRLMSTKEMLGTRAVLDDLAAAGDFDSFEAQAGPGIRPLWWDTLWLPFAANGVGDHLCLDLNPASTGRVGQVMAFWHDDGRRQIVCAGLREWLEQN